MNAANSQTLALDRTMLRGTLVFLFLPVLIFELGFFRAIVAVPAAALTLWGFFAAWRNLEFKPLPLAEGLSPAARRRLLALTVLGAAVWVWFSGVSGFSYQTADFWARNAIFHDLIRMQWPPVYELSGEQLHPLLAPLNGGPARLCYYIGIWLPAALLGKLCGETAADTALYFWVLWGVLCAVYFFARAAGDGRVWWALAMLALGSGMDYIGYAVFIGEWLPPLSGAHLENYAGIAQYSSQTTQLYWVYNQALPAWVAALLAWECFALRRSLWLFAPLFFFAPMPAVGAVAFFCFWQIKAWKARGFAAGIKESFSAENFAGLALAGLSLAFFSGNINVSAGFSHQIGEWSWGAYAIFVMLEFALAAAIIAPKFRRDGLFYLVIAELLLLPLLKLGDRWDLPMRGSIVPLLFFWVYALRFLFDRTAGKPARIALIALLAIGALTPLQEGGRALYMSAKRLFVERSGWYSLRDDHVYSLMLPSGLRRDPCTNFLAVVGKGAFAALAPESRRASRAVESPCPSGELNSETPVELELKRAATGRAERFLIFFDPAGKSACERSGDITLELYDRDHRLIARRQLPAASVSAMVPYTIELDGAEPARLKLTGSSPRNGGVRLNPLRMPTTVYSTESPSSAASRSTTSPK